MSKSESRSRFAGRYELIERLGSGAFGESWRAHDTHLAHDVVLKLAREDVGAEQFEAEARATATLEHPNVVKAVSFGVDDDGRAYLVYEYIAGGSLEQQLRSGPLSLADAVDVARCVGRALQYAHAQGVLHRDVKPSNVLIPGGNRFAEAKLADFGAFGRLLPETSLTRSGEIVGTPLYMSPEQVRGDALSPAADAYGLGVLLYEMIYGGAPYEGSPVVVLQQILTRELTLPEVPEVPGPVRSLILRLLAKDPEQRPGLAEVLGVLQRFVASPKSDAHDATTVVLEAHDGTTVAPRVDESEPSSFAGHSQRERLLWIVVGLALFAAGSVAVFLSVLSVSGESVAGVVQSRSVEVALGVIAGLAVAAVGIGCALGVQTYLRGRRPAIAEEASLVLTGVSRREWLTETLAVDVQKLIERCRTLDQRILGRTLAIMVEEYQQAGSRDDRVATLRSVVEITTRLIDHLTPWYVRYEKVVTFFVGVVGLAAGVLTLVRAIGA